MKLTLIFLHSHEKHVPNSTDRKQTYSLVSLLNPSPYGMCLERKSTFFGLFKSNKVGMGSCSHGGSKNWKFEFTDRKHVKLSSEGQCLVRGKGGYRSSATVQNCKKGEFLPLVYHPTAVHENGFYLKTADNRCLDGERFTSCSGSNAKDLLWGVGIKYIWGKANRYFFSIGDKSQCLVARGSRIAKGDCKDAVQWGLIDGRLSQGNGKNCVVRLQDNSAALARCSDANEYVALEVPQTYTQEDLANMVKNQDKLSEEERAMLQQLLRQQQGGY